MKYDRLRATVMGLGLFGGGSAVARWLAQKGAIVTVTDTAGEDRLADSLDALRSVPIHRYTLGYHRDEDFLEADLVVVNPAVRPGSPWLARAREAGVTLTSEIDLFLANCPARVIAVTGSNGKSTTAAMIASMLAADNRKVFLGGNIGNSLLEQVATIQPDECVVLELSSFQLYWLGQETKMPEIAVVTNFTPNHLNWHPDLEHYAAAKQRLLKEQARDGIAVLDTTLPGLSGWQQCVHGERAAPRSICDVPPLRVCGEHNQTNASIAAAAASSAGCSETAIEIGLREFGGLPDRLELIGEVDGRRCFNDSASTTPESTIAALEALKPPLWLLAGGADKGVDYEDLASHIAKRADGSVFYGQVARNLAEMVASRGAHRFISATETLHEAFALCLRQAPVNATIVLSPGCSSHDQFANYRQRGVAFAELVQSCRRESQSVVRSP